jgi:hypothetical protein
MTAAKGYSPAATDDLANAMQRLIKSASIFPVILSIEYPRIIRQVIFFNA